MEKKSRKNNINVVLGEQTALPSFDLSKFEKKDGEYVKIKTKDKEKKKFNLKTFSIIALILLIVATLLFTLRFINFNASYLIWKTSLTKGSDSINNKSIKYNSFNNGLMRISNDGLTYIDENGIVVYTVSYNMKEPIYVHNEEYFYVADKNGYSFYIFDKKGVAGTNTTTNPIIKISESNNGVLYVLQSDDNNSFINVYRKDGTPIDIMIKTSLTEDGMPIDLSSSNNGEELCLSNVCLDDTDLYTKATYYNFSDAGKNAGTKRVVGEFKNEFDGKFLARAHFFDDKNSCLIYDGGVYYVSTDDESRPKIISHIEFDDKIRSISYNEKYLALVFEDNKLRVYNNSGNLYTDKQIDFEYDNFYISDNYIIFLYNNRVMIYDARGRMIFDKELDKQVQYVAKKKSILFTELLIGLIDGVECIRFY